MYGVVFRRMRRSTTLDGVHSRVIGLYEAACVGVLFGFNRVMIFPTFQM